MSLKANLSSLMYSKSSAILLYVSRVREDIHFLGNLIPLTIDLNRLKYVSKMAVNGKLYETKSTRATFNLNVALTVCDKVVK